MKREYIAFVREIYKFCDENTECGSVMFPVFVKLWHENGYGEPLKRDLVRFTSKIINRLIKKGDIIEDFEKRKFNTGYGFYKVLPHENYLRFNSLIEKKTELMK